MKLQPALIFGEHMVLQRDEPIPVWGRSIRDDKITVTLGGVGAEAAAARAVGNTLVLTSEAFGDAGSIVIRFAEQNYCVDPLFNSAGLPAFPFTAEV